MLLFECSVDDAKLLEDFKKEIPNQATIIKPFALDGNAVIQLLVEVTKITAPLVAGYLMANRNNNKITIKKNGVDITMMLSKKMINKLELEKKITEMISDDNSK